MLTYWSRLPDKVRVATYAGPTVAMWWERLARSLGCSHPMEADRMALATALTPTSTDTATLIALRSHTEALCLRVRLALQLARESQPTLED